MIDYIKILKIVLTEINNTIKLHTKKLNNDKFEPNKDPELRKLLIMHPMIYSIGLLATTLPLFFIIISLGKSQTTSMTKLILTICTLIVGIILLLIDLKTYNNIIKIRYKLTKQHNDFIWEATKTIEIAKTKELLESFTNEKIENKDVNSLINYNYYGDSNIPVKGNLYEIPIKTMLQKANVKSIQNLYKNINFLSDYYLMNYVEDDEYTWITKQLNAFYNSEIAEDIDDIELLKNLKN